jgi:glycosyltransferase involved in cell wall biosynthesis
MAYLIRALEARHDVAALYLRERGELAIDDDLQGSLRRVEEVPYPRHLTFATRLARRTAALRGIPAWASFVDVPEFAHRVREVTAAWRPDIVHFEYHVMGQYARALPDRRAARILSEYEAGVLAAREHVATDNDGSALGASLQRRAWERFERRVIAAMDAVVVFSERDKAALAPLAGKTPIVRIGIGTHVPRFPLEPLGAADHPRLVFIGNFMHPPNVDAALRLTDSIFPAVQTRVPGSVLRIVGAHPPAELLSRARDGIDVTGRVPDVVPWLNAAALVVVPLRVGGGMRVKVVEALAHGKAVVASPRALEGLNVTDGVEVAIADTDDQFVTRIVSLLESPGLRSDLAQKARAWAVANLGAERWVAAYEALYDQLRPVAR